MTTYALTPQIFYSGSYHDIVTGAAEVAAAGVSYTRGVTDELDLQPGSCTFRILDDDDRYRPSNPLSPLYGIIGPYLPFLYKVDGNARFAGELGELQPGQSDDFKAGPPIKGVRYVDVKATGPLGTVGRWRDAPRSPMYLQISSYANLRGYFPGEDPAGATGMSSAYTGIKAAVATGVSFAAADGPGGSDKLLTLGSTADITGTFAANISTTGWQIQFTTDMAGADGTERQIFYWTTTNGYTWVWQASLTTYRIKVLDKDGTSLLDAGVLNGGAGPGQNVTFRWKCSLSAGTWTVESAWYSEGDDSTIGTTNTFSGVAGRPTGWRTSSNTVMNGAFFGHLFVVTGTSDNLQSGEMINALNGYAGQSTRDAFVRVCNLRSIPNEVLGDDDTAILMGPQRVLTVKALLQEIRQTEHGLIFENKSGRGLVLALRSYLYAQAADPVLELTWPTDIAPGFTELATTLELYNTVIIQDRASGQQATAVQPDGRYGTADPPAGCGVVDKQVGVNVQDPADLDQHASAYLWYFQQVARVGPITIDLDANPGLATAVQAADIGQFIRVSGRTPEPLLLMIVRISGKDQRARRTVTFETVPGDVFDVGSYDDGRKRYSSGTTTLKTGAAAAATSLTFRTTDPGDLWSTSANLPYPVQIEGIKVTVSAMGAASLVSGAYDQVATVSGVTKALSAGSSIITNPADAGRWAL